MWIPRQDDPFIDPNLRPRKTGHITFPVTEVSRLENFCSFRRGYLGKM
ncbi:hypothetical protein MJ1HA_1478 [Metallosphaera sedula]|nr:hypothetical protein MJ1HA_1478 [Metallosphaera sedula]